MNKYQAIKGLHEPRVHCGGLGRCWSIHPGDRSPGNRAGPSAVGPTALLLNHCNSARTDLGLAKNPSKPLSLGTRQTAPGHPICGIWADSIGDTNCYSGEYDR